MMEDHRLPPSRDPGDTTVSNVKIKDEEEVFVRIKEEEVPLQISTDSKDTTVRNVKIKDEEEGFVRNKEEEIPLQISPGITAEETTDAGNFIPLTATPANVDKGSYLPANNLLPQGDSANNLLPQGDHIPHDPQRSAVSNTSAINQSNSQHLLDLAQRLHEHFERVNGEMPSQQTLPSLQQEAVGLIRLQLQQLPRLVSDSVAHALQSCVQPNIQLMTDALTASLTNISAMQQQYLQTTHELTQEMRNIFSVCSQMLQQQNIFCMGLFATMSQQPETHLTTPAHSSAPPTDPNSFTAQSPPS